MKKIIFLAMILLLVGCSDAANNSKENILKFQAEGASMAPVFEHGDEVHVDLAYYGNHEVTRGDIIVFEDGEFYRLKRVFGLPGETIQIENGKLIINGEVMEVDYMPLPIDDFDVVEIPLDTFFVIGDNAMISKDSRNGMGFIPFDHIVGKAVNE